MKKTKKPTYQIPFTKDGKLFNYVGMYGTKPEDIVWKENVSFAADMVYEGYGRGRSSALVYLRNTYTEEVNPMFLTSFDDLMKAGRATIRPDGSIKFTGKWDFCKKGENYAMKMATD